MATTRIRLAGTAALGALIVTAPAATAAGPAHAAEPEPTRTTGHFTEAESEHTVPPPCVSVAAGWRYTFVTNDCDQPVSIHVHYADESPGPCRTVTPGMTATFPGYGPGEYRPPRVGVC